MNVFFRDFQNIVATFQMFTHWIVPMIYPFAKLADQRHRRRPGALRPLPRPTR